MRTLTPIDLDYGNARITEHDLTWISDERLADFGITVKEVRRLFAKGWRLVDRELSHITETEKPDVHPVAYRRADSKWEVSLCVDDEVESTSDEKGNGNA